MFVTFDASISNGEAPRISSKAEITERLFAYTQGVSRYCVGEKPQLDSLGAPAEALRFPSLRERNS